MTRNIDIEDLISRVFEKPALWDKSHKYYSNRAATSNCWGEISCQMNEDEAKLRKKWRYLRDQFAVELGKLPPYRPEDEATTAPKWPYFKSLLFLKNIVTPRSSSTGLRRSASPLAVDVKVENTSEESDVQSSHGNDIIDNDIPDPVSPPSPKRLKILSADRERRNRQYLHERRSLRQEQQSIGEEDENLLFFRSLLPHVRKIQTHNLLSFRSRVQDVVEEFAYRS